MSYEHHLSEVIHGPCAHADQGPWCLVVCDQSQGGGPLAGPGGAWSSCRTRRWCGPLVGRGGGPLAGPGGGPLAGRGGGPLAGRGGGPLAGPGGGPLAGPGSRSRPSTNLQGYINRITYYGQHYIFN